MEGPVDSLPGVLNFVGSQLTTHQYNVAAGDSFLQQQQVSLIQNSTAWNTAGQRDAIIITWDENFNNLGLGIGNEGNHVPMIVIPDQGAITSGGNGFSPHPGILQRFGRSGWRHDAPRRAAPSWRWSAARHRALRQA